MGPKRIQRKRIKGWTMPNNTIYVGRPSVYGNPYSEFIYGKDEALRLYRVYMKEMIVSKKIDLTPLIGKNLACWCPLNEPCHADYLLLHVKALEERTREEFFKYLDEWEKKYYDPRR